jgi:hypothetical protein
MFRGQIITAVPLASLGAYWLSVDKIDVVIALAAVFILLIVIEAMLARRFRLHEASEQKFTTKLLADSKGLTEQTLKQLESFDTSLHLINGRLNHQSDRIDGLFRRVEALEQRPTRSPDVKSFL